MVLYATGTVATASAKAIISRLSNEVGENGETGEESAKVGLEETLKGAMISFIKVIYVLYIISQEPTAMQALYTENRNPYRWYCTVVEKYEHI